MKLRFFLIILIVIIGVAGGLLWMRNNQGPASSSTSSAPHQYAITHWGAIIRAYGMDKPHSPYNKQSMVQQMDYLKDLGATDARANAEVSDAVNDDFVNLALERHLEPTLILETPQFFEKETRESMYTYGKRMAERYKGKVKYYQLGNEASGVALKPGFPGNKSSDYDTKKYQHFRDLARGLSEGIHTADPAAQRIISAHWVGVGVIDMLVADKVDFEIIGWDWYSDMGNDMVKTLSDGSILDIPAYLSKYNKDVWVAELSRREGTKDGKQQAYADFIRNFVSNAITHPQIKGIFVFSLTDQCDALTTDYGTMGLVGLTGNPDGTCTVSGKKPAFATYKDLITQYNK